jgi:glutamate dehydrogenase
MISDFDTSKLSSKGFRVLVDEQNIKLPDGTVVTNGLRFRNEFHLDMGTNAEVFVPCGGRPESVDLSNVHRLLDSHGKSKYKYIVEGANLFFTQVSFFVAISKV